ncbi:MAG: FecR domain-containing protein [Planctomycetaceae bacterium]|nr:FecR domain-containing protein [Planctomycetaceae bacterium]
MPIHDELILAYLDGDTSPQQERQVRRLLHDPKFCRRLAQLANDTACLHELAQIGALEDEKQTALTGELDDRAPGFRLGIKRLWFPAGVVLIVSALALLTWLPNWPNKAQNDNDIADGPIVGRMVRVSSAVIERNGLETKAVVDSVVRSGDLLVTQGPEAFAVVEFQDGTRLFVLRETRVRIAEELGQKIVHVLRGDIDADVVPQAETKPMLLVTSQAESRVMGTRLSLSVAGNATTLGVTEGHVIMKRLSDGRSVDILAGHHAVASPSSDLISRPIPPAPDTWNVDFEEGLPDGWGVGQWVSDDLPEHSRGAARAVRKDSGGRHYFMLRSNKISTSGLFRIESDSYLNFTYKLERPGWFNLFIGVRNNELGQTLPGNYAHKQPSWWKIPPGEWRTVSVPISEFHRVIPGDFKGPDEIRPRAGDAVNIIWFSTPEKDRGMTVDRVWVTRGKPDANQVIRGDE